ncbi:RHS repeat-associated core domain-containing protein [Sphaerotilus sp.]|uniref:RHS repeat-associated core domain-containing protein n=1 Tax=Sphaerotilus sp. TaxID=2093942 RepID=UPI002ACDEE65|nr:RHS repeat-associated core domain-containing protein [Sphaerotilus sp.]MDZ7858414.1 RHS repeat-associated core domain-containing protein [Sphaerotilus sp.]
MFKFERKRDNASHAVNLFRALLAAFLLALAVPALAYHFPWDQGHDTTKSNDPAKPGPDERPTANPAENPNACGSPIYVGTGHCFWSDVDVVLRGRPFVGVKRTYNSNDPVVGLFGNGWTVDFDIALYPATSSGQQQRVFKAANGKRFIYVKQANGTFLAPASRFETITEGANSVTMTLLDGRRNVFALDGRLLERWDTNGNRVSFSYDSSLRPVRIDDGNGRSLTMAYNAASLVASVTDHTGRVWRYSYDTNANLTSITDPANGVMGYTWQAYRPPADANTYYQLLSVTDPSNVVRVTFTYTGNQVASYTEGADRITYTRPTTNTPLAGTVTRRDSLNVATSFTYGALGLITREVNGIGGATSYTFDDNGRITATVDALNRTWSSTYDSLGRLTASRNPLAQNSTIQYTGNDPRPVRMTSPSGRVVTLAYDSRGNLTSTTDPAGANTAIAYNARGDVTAIRNALGQQTSIAYTASGLPTQVTDPLGRSSTMTYDALGRVATATNAAGETTRYAYDALDRVTRVTDPMSQVTAFTYDAAGRLTSVTDAKGSVTQYEYDAFGRRSAEIAPDSRRTSYAYRTDNLLSSITWPDNTSISYQYDNNKRVTRETAGSEVINFSYNAVNQLLSASGPGGTVSYTYDNAGRVVTETSGGKTNTITRNAEGERIGLAYLGQTQTYTRDARGLVTQIASPAGNFGFDFDELGRRTKLSYPNGSTASYSFDAAGQLTNLTHAGVFNAPYAHSFDTAGRITNITGDGPDWNYSYDALGRLTRATQGNDTYTYTLDAVGNILDGSRTHDVNHRLTADASKTYSYDQRGNLTLEQDRTTGARTVYTWNLKNQLMQVQFFSNATAGSLTRTLAYTYDPMGRRASKTDNGSVQRFVSDEDDLVGSLDAGANVLASVTFGGMVDEPLASIGSGSSKLIFSNHQGSVTAIADNTSVTYKYRYGPYGEVVPPSSADSSPFRFTGREKDTDSLYFYRSRYYSTAIQRFISSDAIGLSGGVNTYAYVDGNPVSYTDPTGEIIPILACIANPWCRGAAMGALAFTGNIIYQSIAKSDCPIDWGEAASWGVSGAGVSMGIGAGLSGGTNSVFWSGAGNLQRAASLGRSLESTPIGSLMNGRIQAKWAWDAASAIYAGNARGTAIKVGTQAGRTWTNVELPILTQRGIPITIVP